MELQFKNRMCSCLGTVTREMSVQELTQEVKISDSMADIGRVLSSWGQMIIRSKEWRGDTVTVTGGVMVWVLYAPEDGTEPRCIDAWIPYQLRWDHLDTDREGPVRISPLLRFVDARTVSPRKFMVRAGAAASAQAFTPGQVQLFSPEELPEDIEVFRRTYPVRLPKEAGEKTFLADEDLSITGTAPERLLSYTVRPGITDCRVLSNKVVFRGNCNLHLIYQCKEGRIRTQDFEIPFSQYAELEESYSADAQADIWFGVTSLELDLDDQGQLRFKCGLVAQYLVDDREMMELVEDAYSPRRQVAVKTESLVLPAILENRTENIVISQSLPGCAGEVVDVNFIPDFPRQRQTAEGVAFELPGAFHVLYYGEDGALQAGSARWEENFTLPAGEGCRVNGQVIPAEQARAVSGMDGFDLSGQLQLRMDTTSDNGLTMVTGLEVGEMQEPDPGRPSLILCRPGKEGLWEIAKRCGSTMSAIQSTNGIQEEVAADRILLIPVS